MYTHRMKTIIRTWGNSLAIRIPKAFALQIGIDNGKEVQISVDRDGLRIDSVHRDLDAHLACITEENLHGEIRTGSATGKEVW